MEEIIRAERVGWLLRYMPSQYLGGIAVVTLFIVYFSDRLPDRLVLGWVGLILTIYVLGYLMLALLRRTPRTAPPWRRFALVYGFGGGAVWGVASVLFFDVSRPDSLLFLLPSMIGLAAVGVAGLISYLRAVALFLVAALGPFCLVLLHASQMSHVFGFLAILVAACAGGFMAVATLSNRHLIQAWRYRAELQDSESRFRDFASAASEWFWETDPQNRLIYLSEQAVAYREDRLTEVLGRRREDMAKTDRISRPEHWRPYDEAIAERRPFRDFVYPIKLRGGVLAWANISGVPVYDENGRFLGYRGTGRDVTPDLEVREGLKAAQRQLLAAVEAYPGAFFLYDSQDRLVMFNSRSLEWYEKIEGLLVPGTTFAEIALAYAKAYHTSERDIDAWVHKRVEQFHNPSEAVVLNLSDGRHILAQETKTAEGGTVSVRMDISRLIEAQLAAAQANRSKSEFLANMSHELRTPLNAIIGFADAMRHAVIGPIGNPTYADYIEHIHQSGEHLLSLISDILDVSAVEAGRISLSEVDIDLDAMLGQCVALVRGRAEEKGIALTSSVDEGMHLRADERRVKQVVLNLLGNSVKFTPRGGTIEVTATASPEGGLVLAVRDSGPGIAPDEIELALSPFGRTKSAVDSAQEGTGLGLPLSNSLMEAHGGQLTIESGYGKGCTISAIFPSDRVTRVSDAVS